MQNWKCPKPMGFFRLAYCHHTDANITVMGNITCHGKAWQYGSCDSCRHHHHHHHHHHYHHHHHHHQYFYGYDKYRMCFIRAFVSQLLTPNPFYLINTECFLSECLYVYNWQRLCSIRAFIRLWLARNKFCQGVYKAIIDTECVLSERLYHSN